MAKIVLFDGTSLDMWRKPDGEPSNWKLHEDGTMTPSRDDTVSTVTFKDAHIHVEFREPSDDEREEGQFHDGNSGVYIHGCYEIQIIDSYGDAPPKENPCGAVYEMYMPRVNASRPVREWQTYDIYFRAPRFNEKDEMTEAARATVIHNGECIHNNVILHWATPGGITDHPVKEGPLMLQGYRFDPVRFRNVWIETL
ncbi:MAG: DUF1080 domain-containing protein [Ruminococcaceae bacterium]|nr:DUF1080 domain-containing protein [Oscillospiraceae bacterium]